MISKELFKKLEGIILSHDIRALKCYSERLHSSKIPGNVPLSYSIYGVNGKLGYLLDELTDSEKEEMKNFTLDDLNKILYIDRGISLPIGIQQIIVGSRNIARRKRGRWGL